MLRLNDRAVTHIHSSNWMKQLADGKTYNVTAVGRKAFTAKKIRTVTVGAKKVNKKFVKKYKKFFTKKNAGKKATVK